MKTEYAQATVRDVLFQVTINVFRVLEKWINQEAAFNAPVQDGLCTHSQ